MDNNSQKNIINNYISLQDKNTRTIKIEKLNKTNNSIITNNNLDQSEINPTANNAFITKGRKTLYNPSFIHLESPKKQNPTRSKRITLFNSSTKREIKEYENELNNPKNTIDFNGDILSNVTFGEPSGSSSQIISDIITENNSFNNNRYKILIKKIAKNLKKRVKFPKCKIFKFYNSYRMLILRIAKGIKKTAKQLNFWEKWENNITEKEIIEIQEIASTSCKIIQERNNGSKKNINLSPNKKSKKNVNINLSLFKKITENEESKSLNNKKDNNKEITKTINYLKELDSSINNINYINQFLYFLQKYNIEICPETKLPIFSDNKNKYLLSSIDFWIKYVIYVSIKYKDSLTLYNFIDFIEQFYLWIDKNKKSNFEKFNNEIIKQINILFNQNIINDFLLTYKINSLNDLFARYKIIYLENYKEVKLKEECQCATCQKLFYEKIVNYNKNNNRIILSKENNISYIGYNKNKKKKSSSYKDKEILDYFNSNKKKNEPENKKKNKVAIKSKSKKNNKKNKMKVEDIFDILSIDGDVQNIEEIEDIKNEEIKGRNQKKNKKK